MTFVFCCAINHDHWLTNKICVLISQSCWENYDDISTVFKFCISSSLVWNPQYRLFQPPWPSPHPPLQSPPPSLLQLPSFRGEQKMCIFYAHCMQLFSKTLWPYTCYKTIGRPINSGQQDMGRNCIVSLHFTIHFRVTGSRKGKLWCKSKLLWKIEN